MAATSRLFRQTPKTKTKNKVVYVDSFQGIVQAKKVLKDRTYLGVDTETTGLNPRTDKVRILSVSTGDNLPTYVIDIFKTGWDGITGLLKNHILIMHNALFDLQFLHLAGVGITYPVYDTMLLSQILLAGTKESSSLENCCKRILNQELNKEQQKSDWSGDLTEEQIKYAGKDSYVLLSLYEQMKQKTLEAGLSRIVELETACLKSIVAMSLAGIGVNLVGWAKEVDGFSTRSEELKKELAVYGDINWNSPKQVKEYFAKHGKVVTSTAHAALLEMNHPLADLVDKYRTTSKRVSTYGKKWIKFLLGSRVHPHWRQIGTDTGRMSCSKPNLQQVPRDSFRKHIVPSEGKVLIKGDYSQIELRIAAEIASDPVLKRAFNNKEDLYTEGAKRLLGVKEVTKKDRQISKSLHLGLIYGMGIKKLVAYTKTNFGITLSLGQAKTFRDKFFATYTGLDAWHARTRWSDTTETRTVELRRRLIDKEAPGSFRLNSPVQGTGADGLKRALCGLDTDMVPVIASHDEIVVEYPEALAEEGASRLKDIMVRSMQPLIPSVPVEAEVTYGKAWGK